MIEIYCKKVPQASGEYLNFTHLKTYYMVLCGFMLFSIIDDKGHKCTFNYNQVIMFFDN